MMHISDIADGRQITTSLFNVISLSTFDAMLFHLYIIHFCQAAGTAKPIDMIMILFLTYFSASSSIMNACIFFVYLFSEFILLFNAGGRGAPSGSAMADAHHG